MVHIGSGLAGGRPRGTTAALAVLALVVWLLTASTAGAAITFVGDLGANEANGVGAVALGITTTAAAPAGSSIIIVASSRSGEASGPTSVACTDSAGHTYTTDRSQASLTTLTSICATHQIAATLSAGATLTVTWTGGFAPFNQRARAFAVTGLATSPLDQTASATGTSGAPSSGATATTTRAEELLVGAIDNDVATVAGAGFSPGTNGTANICATSGSSTYTALAGVGSTQAPALFGMYCIVGATGAYSAQATLSNAPTWEALVATYRGALTPPTIAKAFGASTIDANTTTTLSFTLSNPNLSPLTGVGFTDTLPEGVVVATPNGLTGSCGGGTITATAGSNSISLSGATLAGGASCNFALNVTATSSGTKVNTTTAVTSIEAGPGNTATATLLIGTPAVPALSTVAQLLVVLVVVLSGLLFLRRRVSVGR
jgi:hypothetical protein